MPKTKKTRPQSGVRKGLYHIWIRINYTEYCTNKGPDDVPLIVFRGKLVHPAQLGVTVLTEHVPILRMIDTPKFHIPKDIQYRTNNVLKAPSCLVRSAWEWYLGLGKDINRYRFRFFNFDLEFLKRVLKFWASKYKNTPNLLIPRQTACIEFWHTFI